ncbi:MULTISPECIES: NUDIX domain-containing protein [Pseudomonas]|nr:MULTISPECIES: NUDIX domain-containing protein [Pseudomonas]
MECAMLPNKACPVVLSSSLPVRLLLFRYPLAHTQLMKGTFENGETTREAALRELTEESGIDDAMAEIDLGILKCGTSKSDMVISSLSSGATPARALGSSAMDDHGHMFQFYWAPLDDPM